MLIYNTSVSKSMSAVPFVHGSTLLFNSLRSVVNMD